MLLSFDIKKVRISENVLLDLTMKGEFLKGITHIKGDNGSGKTTLLKAIVGIYELIGSCKINGVSIKNDPMAYKKHIGFCPDKYLFTESISSREYLHLMKLSYDVKNTNFIRESEKIGLYPFLDKPINKLSYGNKKKLLLISSLIHDPKVWVIDEPVNGLDKRGEQWLIAKLKEKIQNDIVLITCHANWLDQFEKSEHVVL